MSTGACAVPAPIRPEDELRRRILFWRHGAAVKRYHAVHTLQQQTVGAHSAGVAYFCLLVVGRPTPQLLLAALTHDLAEQYIGDVPGHTKHDIAGVGAALEQAEQRILNQYGCKFDLTDYERDVLRFADCAEGFLTCIGERRMGNRDITEVGVKYRHFLEQFPKDASMYDVFHELRTMWQEASDESK
jgi:5'-deoxynucleotidase YfbR-like HD superfamily hydrolase